MARGLEAYQASQHLFPSTLYGMSLFAILPVAVVVLTTVLVVLIALRVRGVRSLARFGVATVIASPSLYSHGFLVALPAILELRTAWLLVALGVTAVPTGFSWWLVLPVVALSWLSALGRHAAEAHRNQGLHPLGATPGPWPGARAEQSPRRSG